MMSNNPQLKHSRLGIASFSLSIGVVIIALVTCILIYYAFLGWPIPEYVVNFLCFVPISAYILLVVSLGLGIGALYQKDRKVIFASIGIILSAVMFLFFGLLTVLISFIRF